MWMSPRLQSLSLSLMFAFALVFAWATTCHPEFLPSWTHPEQHRALQTARATWAHSSPLCLALARYRDSCGLLDCHWLLPIDNTRASTAIHCCHPLVRWALGWFRRCRDSLVIPHGPSIGTTSLLVVIPTPPWSILYLLSMLYVVVVLKNK
jgi:hypothetical protein